MSTSKKTSTEKKQLAGRVPESVVNRIDKCAQVQSKRCSGITITRSQIVEILVMQALPRFEKACGIEVVDKSN